MYTTSTQWHKNGDMKVEQVKMNENEGVRASV